MNHVQHKFRVIPKNYTQLISIGIQRMKIRETHIRDIVRIIDIYEHARYYMQKNGNPDQWIDGYPQKEIIEADIKSGQHYICIENDNILGCFAFIFGDDPTYQVIEQGKWLNSEPYAVLHRLATVKQGKGIGDFCLKWCTRQYQNIRADTHKNNISMQKLLLKNSFKYCGIIPNRWGDKRMAYQKFT